MDDAQESFVCRMVRRRVSPRNNHDSDGILNSSINRDSRRRYNILKAIDDHGELHKGMDDSGKFEQSYDYRSSSLENSANLSNNNNNEKSMDSYNRVEKIAGKSPEHSTNGLVSSYVKSFELGRVKWRGPLASNYLTKSSSSFPEIGDHSGSHESNSEGPPRLIKVTAGNISPSSKMIARLTNVENKNEEIFPGYLSQMSQSSMQSLTSLSAVIDDLDAQIKALEIEEANAAKVEATREFKRIYPVIEDINFEPTGWTPRKEIDEKTKKNSDTFFKDNLDEIMAYDETPKKATRKMPLMESTRKSPHSDSTKIKFPTPTRVESTISTIEGQLTPPSPDYKYRNDDESRGTDGASDTTAPFEVEQFLQDALGDELYNTTVTFDASEARDRTNSHMNASDRVSKETTPLQRRIMHALHPPATDPTSGSSNTLNRSKGLYRTLSQRIKKKFRSVLKTKEESPSPPKISRDDHEADIIGQLLQEVSVQQTLMNQASKALNVCHTMKEFMESSERVESDRLLLVAGLRRTAALEEIKRISSQDNRRDKEFLGERGEITLKDMSLNLRECLKAEPQEGETVEWFVVVVSQGLKVWATRAISCPINKLTIDFPEVVSIPNLTPNFKILVQVYSLKLRSATYNHEDKYRIRRRKRSTSCPPFLVSPTRFLKKSESPMSPKLHRSSAAKSSCTCFVLSGFVELFLHDLSLSSPWPLMLVPENSILDRTMDLSLACRLHLSVSHEGFLNHGDEAGGLASWNRRWCVLKGHTLMLWNYPRDQETKEPLTVIELINCVSNKITTANRTICAKPRTLLIETVRRRNATDRDSIVYECRSSCTIVRNFLSCDSVHELVEWSTKLNHVVLALREWNVIGTRPPQVSDL